MTTLIRVFLLITCYFSSVFSHVLFRPCITISAQTPGNGQSRNEYRSSKFLPWFTWSRYHSCIIPMYSLIHILVVLLIVYWLSTCLAACVCLSVPWRNHQKHPGGSGDNNLWSIVLSACCHRIGYQGSGDPHRISKRGKFASSVEGSEPTQQFTCSQVEQKLLKIPQPILIFFYIL